MEEQVLGYLHLLLGNMGPGELASFQYLQCLICYTIHLLCSSNKLNNMEICNQSSQIPLSPVLSSISGQLLHLSFPFPSQKFKFSGEMETINKMQCCLQSNSVRWGRFMVNFTIHFSCWQACSLISLTLLISQGRHCQLSPNICPLLLK